MKVLRKLLISMPALVALPLFIASAAAGETLWPAKPDSVTQSRAGIVAVAPDGDGIQAAMADRSNAADNGPLAGLITKAEQREVGAQLQLGNAYYYGKGTGKNLDQAFFWYEKAAGQGHPGAQRALGAMYKLGKGTARNPEKAAYWYEKAAVQGYAMAQTNLGILYETGEGVAQNYDTARGWYEKAADQNDARAQTYLGILYESGNGVAQNYDTARGWYEKAAAQGYAKGQTHLGRMYELGLGGAVDFAKAFTWYQQAAAQGDARAQTNLGALYKAGLGVDQDYGQAVVWYSEAAAQDYPRGQLYLGRMFEQGLGVDKDRARAAEWYTRAAALGFAPAREELAEIKQEPARADDIAQQEKQKEADRTSNRLLTASSGKKKMQENVVPAPPPAAQPAAAVIRPEAPQAPSVETVAAAPPTVPAEKHDEPVTRQEFVRTDDAAQQEKQKEADRIAKRLLTASPGKKRVQENNVPAPVPAPQPAAAVTRPESPLAPNVEAITAAPPPAPAARTAAPVTRQEVAPELKVEAPTEHIPSPQAAGMVTADWQKVASNRMGAMEQSVELDGIIEPFVIIDIGTPVDGVVQDVMVERSNIVKAGQLLLQLDASVEKALVNKARSRAKNYGEIELQKEKLAFAERAHDRIDDLYTKKAISSQKKDEAYTEVTLARQRLQKAEEEQQLAEMELKQAEALLNQRYVKSPISGIVVDRYISQGQFVDNQPLLRIAQIDPLRVEVIVPSHLFGKIKPGMKATVLPELQEFGSHTATVTIVDRVIDAASNSFAVRLEIPNPDYIIPSGLKCSVHFAPDYAPALATITSPGENTVQPGAKNQADPKN